MSVNLSNTTPAAPSGSTNVTFQTDGSGNVSAYVTTSTELTADGVDTTGLSANVGATDLVVSPSGKYRISGYIIVTTVDGASSTLPSIVISWNDFNNGQGQTLTLTPTSTGNVLTTYEQADCFINANVSANIQYSTTGYASGTPATMKYALHITVEKL
jgi:hypothetical protein